MIFAFPSLPSIILWAMMPALFGFALAHRYGYDGFTLLAMLFFGLGGWYGEFIYLQIMLEDFKRSIRLEPSPQRAEKTRNIPDLNRNKYTFQTETVKIDARRHFAILVWRQYEFDKDQIDLTEEYWLRRKPRKWKGKDDEFRRMKRELDGIVFQKKDPARDNSSYIIRDDRLLRRLAEYGKV